MQLCHKIRRYEVLTYRSMPQWSKWNVRSSSMKDVMGTFLKDNTQSIQKILDSVFEKPVGISISQPQKFIMSQGTIASIVMTVLLGCILLVSAVLILTRKTSYKTFWKTSSESTEKIDSQEGNGGSACSVMTKDKGNVAAAKMTQDHQKLHRVIKTQEQADGNDSPKTYIEAQLSEPQMVQTVSEKDTMKEQLPNFIQETQVEYVVTWEPYESEDDSGTDLTRKDGAKYETPSTPDIVTLQEDVEQTENKDDKMTSAVTVENEE
ncbi:uncharacterized protein LOC142143254 [Mixophyes fleayi]|uniref:uncharacterized protein LOC142143254 n=1 Tax=Mixophyes fleayi TaxID=3061075 RepID=UPI003F4E348C